MIPMSDQPGTTRRRFLQTTGAAAAAIVTAPAILRGATVKDAPVRVGHIGTGTRGWSLIQETGASDSAKVMAVCDVCCILPYERHLVPRKTSRALGRRERADRLSVSLGSLPENIQVERIRKTHSPCAAIPCVSWRYWLA